METIITKAICLNSIDYRDNDKLVTLFSLEFGIITATIKGVKNQKAKMKTACQQFCFAEYNLIKRNNKFQIIGYSLIDAFYEFTKDLEKFYLGTILLEISQKSLQNIENTTNAFINLLKCFKAICYEKINPIYVVGHYIAFILNSLGYRINFATCSSCGEILEKEFNFDYDRGSFVCHKCSGPFVKSLSKNFIESLKTIYTVPISQGNTIDFNKVNASEILSFLANDLQLKLETRLYSLENYEKFINFFK